MKSRWNDTVLIAFGFTVGAIVSGMLAGGLFSPPGEKPWLESYGGFLGALATLIGTAVVITQIRMSARQFEATRKAEMSKKISRWEKTDGYALEIVNGFADSVLVRHAALQVEFPEYRSWKSAEDIPPFSSLPATTLSAVSGLKDDFTDGCSTAVVQAVAVYRSRIGRFNVLCAQMLDQIDRENPSASSARFRTPKARDRYVWANFLWRYVCAIRLLNSGFDDVSSAVARTRPKHE